MQFEVTLPNYAQGYAISSDGQRIAYIAQPPEENRTFGFAPWVRIQPRNCPERTTPGGLLWSPDGGSIAFIADRKLKRSLLATGSIQTICDLVGQVVGATWNRAGVILISKANVINRVSDTGGELVPLTTLDATRKETVHALPTFLPDGNHFFMPSAAACRKTRAFLWDRWTARQKRG
jgi:hypothetical protein